MTTPTPRTDISREWDASDWGWVELIIVREEKFIDEAMGSAEPDLIMCCDLKMIVGAHRRLQRDLAAAQEALQDCAAGLLYIRQMHGELYGVAFDRALSKADAAYPEWRSKE